MRYPMMKPAPKKRVLIDSFRGLEHCPAVSAGAFYDMKNLSGLRAPLLCVRPRRTETRSLDGCPTDRVLAVGGRGSPVILDAAGTLWCGGRALPRLLEGSLSLTAEDAAGRSAELPEPEPVLELFPTAGSLQLRYEAALDRWVAGEGAVALQGYLIRPQEITPGMTVTVRCDYTLQRQGPRSLVFLGGWVCVFPDGKYANTVKLRQDQPLEQGVDYGDMGGSYTCRSGNAVFQPCGPDGSARSVVRSETAPDGGFWIDASEPEPVLKVWSESQGLWTAAASYVKCAMPGIAKELRAGDGVELRCSLPRNEPASDPLRRLWSGTHLLSAAFHDPGSGAHREGEDDYVILPGLLDAPCYLPLRPEEPYFFSASRPLPEMDFVVEAANRLWGCRCSGGVNELYGSKLGDFRNWSVFQGLYTDSYRVTRGHSGPYTGAAVLGGCPLFFRADCLEKIYPSAAGDHGVVTVSLEGVEAGSAASAAVIRDRLYYKAESGLCCYNGTLPVPISRALGSEPWHEAAAGVWRSWYYVSMRGADGSRSLFTYNTETGVWYREDGFSFCAAFSHGDRLYLLPEPGGALLCVGQAEDAQGVDWWAETGELLPRTALRRRITRLQIGARLAPGAELRAYLSFDGGPWLRKGSLAGGALRTLSFPVTPRRCAGVRLRLEGSGDMELRSLSWLTEAGSEI